MIISAFTTPDFPEHLHLPAAMAPSLERYQTGKLLLSRSKLRDPIPADLAVLKLGIRAPRGFAVVPALTSPGYLHSLRRARSLRRHWTRHHLWEGKLRDSAKIRA